MDWNQMKYAFSFDDETLKKKLEACGLSLKENYEEWEKELLGNYLKLIVPDEKLLARFNELVNQGKGRPEAIAEVLAPPEAETPPEGENEPEAELEAESAEETESPAANGHKIRKRRKPISLFDLMKEGQKLTGKPITLARGQEFLAASGLPEKMEYSGEEATRFLQACERVVNQGQSLAEVAQAFGVDVGARQTPLDWASKHGGSQTEELERLADKSAQLGEQVNEVYEQAYLARLQQYFQSGEYDRRYQEAKARIRQKRGESTASSSSSKAGATPGKGSAAEGQHGSAGAVLAQLTAVGAGDRRAAAGALAGGSGAAAAGTQGTPVEGAIQTVAGHHAIAELLHDAAAADGTVLRGGNRRGGEPARRDNLPLPPQLLLAPAAARCQRY